jgi:hypothetical protein
VVIQYNMYIQSLDTTAVFIITTYTYCPSDLSDEIQPSSSYKCGDCSPGHLFVRKTSLFLPFSVGQYFSASHILAVPLV